VEAHRDVRMWDFEAPTFSRQSARIWRWDCQPDAPAGCLLLQGNFQIDISVRGWVDPRTIVLLEGLIQLKYPMTWSGIENLTFQFVTWNLNQLNYRVFTLCKNMQYLLVSRLAYSWILRIEPLRNSETSVCLQITRCYNSADRRRQHPSFTWAYWLVITCLSPCAADPHVCLVADKRTASFCRCLAQPVACVREIAENEWMYVQGRENLLI
jgi:hypothetical protein